MSNRIDFFQTSRSDLTIPSSNISVFLEGQLCCFLEVVEIFREGWPNFGWAVFMAGGSLAPIPEIQEPQFLADAAMMHPVVLPDNPQDKWALGNTDKGYIIYNNSPGPVKVDLSKSTGMFIVRWVDPEDGRLLEKYEKVKAGDFIEKKNPQPGPVILWITR